MENEKQLKEGEVLLKEGIVRFPSSPEEKPQLIASLCTKCGDRAFPAKVLCGKCDGTNMDNVLLSNAGLVYSYTVVRQAVPGYQVPGIVAVVKVREDNHLMILAQIKNCGIEDVRCGMEVETIIAELFTNMKGEKVIGYAFQPVQQETK
ncbi:MAG: OB-fold domain-containing protein [Bacteroidetes bacterium]|nr:OB-fold domain-containing protein [Bacteroidota bacterium]